MNINTKDYMLAPSGKGPWAYTWSDKPHRLVYDLCGEVDRLRTQQDKLLVALRFYSDLENYRRLKLRPSYGKDAARLNTGPMSVEKDLGKIAREAIAEVKRERLSGEVK